MRLAASRRAPSDRPDVFEDVRCRHQAEATVFERKPLSVALNDAGEPAAVAVVHGCRRWIDPLHLTEPRVGGEVPTGTASGIKNTKRSRQPGSGEECVDDCAAAPEPPVTLFLLRMRS